MKIAPIDIRQQRFSVKFRGFDPQEVDTFLEMVAEELEELTRENGRLKEDRQKLEHRIEELSANESNVKKTLLAAQTLKEHIMANAKKEAELIIRDARSKSSEIIVSNQSEAASVRDELTGLRSRKRQLILNMRLMLDTHLRMLEAEEKGSAPIQEEIDGVAAGFGASEPSTHHPEPKPAAAEHPVKADGSSRSKPGPSKGPPKVEPRLSVFIPSEQRTDK